MLRTRAACEQARDPVRRREGDDERRQDGDGQRGRPRARLGAEPALGARTREPREDDDAQRVRDEDERDVDRIGGEEAVRLDTVAEFA